MDKPEKFQEADSILFGKSSFFVLFILAVIASIYWITEFLS
ncbi:hypothetical protein [Aquimarina algiphila]|nr:hypothetical protein [Aquimarina algiphila]